MIAPINQAGSDEAGFDTCPGDGSFTITANAAPELSGCFTGSTRSDGLFMYTVSGTTTQYEASVITFEDEDGNVSRQVLTQCAIGVPTLWE